MSDIHRKSDHNGRYYNSRSAISESRINSLVETISPTDFEAVQRLISGAGEGRGHQCSAKGYEQKIRPINRPLFNQPGWNKVGAGLLE